MNDYFDTADAESSGVLNIFKAVVDGSNEAIAISDPDGRFVYINSAHERLFKRSFEDACALTYRSYYTSDSLDVIESEVLPSLVRGVSWEGELDAVDAEGRSFPIMEHADSIMSEDGQMLYSFGIIHEISARREYEHELLESQRHLRKLSERIRTTAEQERRQIAKEIHDAFGAMLTTLRVELARCTAHAEDLSADDIRKNAGSAVGIIDQLLDSVGSICSRLRPPMLDELGLIDALDWYIQSINQRSDVLIHYSPSSEYIELRDDIASCVFRTCQELITNVLRHAEAKNADVNLDEDGNTIILTVEDDGKGIDLESSRSWSMGLPGITEQVAGFGGEFSIGRVHPGGTRAVVKMPLVRGDSIESTDDAEVETGGI